jgi:hypothetical protein
MSVGEKGSVLKVPPRKRRVRKRAVACEDKCSFGLVDKESGWAEVRRQEKWRRQQANKLVKEIQRALERNNTYDAWVKLQRLMKIVHELRVIDEFFFGAQLAILEMIGVVQFRKRRRKGGVIEWR